LSSSQAAPKSIISTAGSAPSSSGPKNSLFNFGIQVQAFLEPSAACKRQPVSGFWRTKPNFASFRFDQTDFRASRRSADSGMMAILPRFWVVPRSRSAYRGRRVEVNS
jgi:hypothetical protein